MSQKKIKRERTKIKQQLADNLPQQEKRVPIKFTKRRLIISVIVILIAGSIFLYKKQFAAVTVNGETISKQQIIRELEKRGGKQVLNDLITQVLIAQEAKRKGIKMSDQEINAETKKVEATLVKQGQNLEQALQQQGMTKQDFTEQMQVRKMIEKMVGRDIEITDKELDEFIKQNQMFIPEATNSAEGRDNAREQLKQQKVKEKYQPWIADLQKKAKINYFVKY